MKDMIKFFSNTDQIVSDEEVLNLVNELENIDFKKSKEAILDEIVEGIPGKGIIKTIVSMLVN